MFGDASASRERTYGWAWLLPFATELEPWDDSLARQWATTLRPLARLIRERYIEFLPRQEYPIRVGVHPNTAFGLSFAYDYASITSDTELLESVVAGARRYYIDDRNCPLAWEPSGKDFLSPCFEKAALMACILAARQGPGVGQRHAAAMIENGPCCDLLCSLQGIHIQVSDAQTGIQWQKDRSMKYVFSAITQRGPLKWPNGAKVALIVSLNLEHWDMVKDTDQPYYAGGPAILPDTLPGNVADFPHYTWREYGQRVGVWRLFETFDQAGVPASCTINAKTALERRPIVDAANDRGWEIVAHNYEQGELLSDYANNAGKERDVILRTLKVYKDVVGRPAKGWLSSSVNPALKARTLGVIRNRWSESCCLTKPLSHKVSRIR